MITVVDYGAGNIGSVLNMIRKVGGHAVASGEADDLSRAEKLLLPGVGSFDDAMRRLEVLGLIGPLKERALAGIPFFGICLGMQLLSGESEEGQEKGLDIIPGRVRRFRFNTNQASLKVPHMGWNHAVPAKRHPLCKGLGEESRFYFVHSYYFQCNDASDILFKSSYGIEFASGVQRGNVMGVQFHPEKSHRFGIQLFKNFVEL